MEESLGVVVKEFRKKEACLTQSGFAQRVGISKPTLISVEKSHRAPSLATYKKLSEAMGVPVKELMELKTKEEKQ